MDPPEDPRLLFYREPKAPDVHIDPSRTSTSRSSRRCRSSGLPARASRWSRARTTVRALLEARARRPHTVLDLDYRPTFWREPEEGAREIGARARPGHGRRRQPRRVRGRRRHGGPGRRGGRAPRPRDRAGGRQARRRGRARREPRDPCRRARRCPSRSSAASAPATPSAERSATALLSGWDPVEARPLRERGRGDRRLTAPVR